MQRFITCTLCESTYNTKYREPMILLCCVQTACRQCLEKMCSAQDKAPFKCKFCKADKFGGAKSNIQLKQIVDHYWESNPYQITCDRHLGDPVSYYCEKDKVMMCDQCYIKDHVTHHRECKPIDNKRITAFLDTAINKLKTHEERVGTMIGCFQDILSQQKRLSSSEYLKLSNDAKQVFDLQEKLLWQDEIIQEKEEELEEEEVEEEEDEEDEWEEEEKIGHQPQGDIISRVVLSEVSAIKEVNEGLDLLYEWSGNRKMRLNLKYRGPRDGTKVDDVQKKINGSKPTFIFIKSHHGLVFGFYTSIPWATPTGSNEKFFRDDTAFIFSLSKKTKHLQYQKEEYAIKHTLYSNVFIVGGGFKYNDIYIQEDYDKVTCNYSDFGYRSCTFKAPEGMSQRDGEMYLGGSKFFRVTDIEVYEVIYD